MDLRATAHASLPLWAQDRLRSLADRTVPARRRERALRRSRRTDCAALAEKVSPEGRVLAGVFQGLRLTTESSWGSAAPYLSGTYEEELEPWIMRGVEARPSVVVDVGAADGYYAVGLARLLPISSIFAFDIDPHAQRACQRTAARNAVTNVDVRGRVDAGAMERILVPGAFVISDCEGFELHLLDPARAPTLRSAFVIVELHDFVDPSISGTIIGRFAGTHDIHLVDESDKTARARPHLAHLTEDELADVLDEGRPQLAGPMQWAVMVPRDAHD